MALREVHMQPFSPQLQNLHLNYKSFSKAWPWAFETPNQSQSKNSAAWSKVWEGSLSPSPWVQKKHKIVDYCVKEEISTIQRRRILHIEPTKSNSQLLSSAELLIKRMVSKISGEELVVSVQFAKYKILYLQAWISLERYEMTYRVGLFRLWSVEIPLLGDWSLPLCWGSLLSLLLFPPNFMLSRHFCPEIQVPICSECRSSCMTFGGDQQQR